MAGRREMAEDAVRRAGAIAAARHRSNQRGSIDHKDNPHDLVTETDQQIERFLVATISAEYPDHAIVAEEGGGREAAPDAVRWYVDPLDGTNNFAHGFPIFCVTMAACHHDRILVGATFDPLRDELYSAARGSGASRNGRPMAVSATDDLNEALVATGFPYYKGTSPDNNIEELGEIMPRVRGLRRAGSAALDLAWVAAGRLDGFWEQGLKPWDIAAGLLLVREAGGRVTDYEGHPAAPTSTRLVATNGWLHDALHRRVDVARTRLRDRGDARDGHREGVR